MSRSSGAGTLALTIRTVTTRNYYEHYIESREGYPSKWALLSSPRLLISLLTHVLWACHKPQGLSYLAAVILLLLLEHSQPNNRSVLSELVLPREIIISALQPVLRRRSLNKPLEESYMPYYLLKHRERHW